MEASNVSTMPWWNYEFIMEEVRMVEKRLKFVVYDSKLV